MFQKSTYWLVEAAAISRCSWKNLACLAELMFLQFQKLSVAAPALINSCILLAPVISTPSIRSVC